MPIKFRCQKCRQFLGISRAKAGAIVDCPSCGRATRVPTLDGKVEPIPEPKLNVGDEHLAKALDELAGLDSSRKSADGERVAPAASQDSPGKVSAAPAAEPIEVDVAVESPEPVVIEPLPRHKKPPKADAGPFPVEQNSSALEELAGTPPLANEPVKAISPRRSPWKAAMLAACVAAAFVGGYFAGRARRNASKAESHSSRAEPDTDRADVPAPADGGPAVTGRLTYKTAGGMSKADAGALVLVFPSENPGRSKLSVAGFRSSASQLDREFSIEGLRRLGGDAAFTDEKGRYAIHLPQPGTYEILAVSHFQPRPDGAVVLPSLQNLLQEFFARPSELLGKLAFHHGQVEYQGETTEVWDHSFEAE